MNDPKTLGHFNTRGKRVLIGVGLVGVLSSSFAADVPTRRPPVEPAEDVLARRGNIVAGPPAPVTGPAPTVPRLGPGDRLYRMGGSIYGGSSTRETDAALRMIERRGNLMGPASVAPRTSGSTSNQVEVARLRAEAARLGDQFGRYDEVNGRLIWTRGDARIEDPVRKQGTEVFVLGPEPRDGWRELIGVKILNVLDEGMLAQIGELSVIIRNHPRQAGVLSNTRISGWVRACHDVYTYRAVTGAEVTCAVLDYGTPLPGDEAAEAIADQVAERKALVDRLHSQADAIEQSGRRQLDERIQRFRAEQQAKQFQSGFVPTTNSVAR